MSIVALFKPAGTPGKAEAEPRSPEMPSDVNFRDVKRLLTKNGWELSRVRGSHHVFTGKGRPTIPIPVHGGKVRHEYAKLVQKEINKLREQEDTA